MGNPATIRKCRLPSPPAIPISRGWPAFFRRGVPNFTAYLAAKGGQNGFNRGLATEVAPWGVTVVNFAGPTRINEDDISPCLSTPHPAVTATP